MTLQDYFIENPQLKKEWVWEKNSEYSDKSPPISRKKVWWRCEYGHEWQASLNTRIHLSRNCPYCANQAIAPGENDLATAFPEIVALWHPARNGELTPAEISPGSSKKVWWQCNRGHEWQAKVYSVKAGAACPYCSGRNAIPGETDLATTHPQFLNAWSTRNKISPESVTAGSHRKVWWICPQNHEWEASVVSVVSDGSACPYCAGKRAISGQNDLATLRPDLMEQWDWEKNRDTDPRQLLPSTHEKVWWKCGLGHSYQSAVFSRSREKGSGCPYCTGRKALPGFNDLATQKPKLAEEWYQPMNEALRPQDVTLGSNRKVWWRCREGHVWRTAIYARTRKNGTNCPVCAGTVRGKQEITIK